ncbi:uncharacterized protein LODBEIA_P15460 [Lodderomyces beijingensis]|uniref:Pre-rRNA-processing protein n=1 Tax=Lodderomyces beijingensis TaxID=1775926 RepID=A0ABP0ZM99_9ASCO
MRKITKFGFGFDLISQKVEILTNSNQRKKLTTPTHTAMGSKRKQKEKQKDFKRAKLKVGKTAQKPDNYTDTSFKSKAISIPGQSITFSHDPENLTHRLSLTKHHSSATRKEVVISITQHLPANPSAYKEIITSIVPLILDESKSVRMEVATLLQAIGEKQPGLLDLHKRSVVLFITSAMTHIQPDIRNTSTKFLGILLEYADLKLYFVKLLKNFFVLMSWSLKDDSKSKGVSVTSNSSILLGANSKKARVEHLKVLTKFLQVSLLKGESEAQGSDNFHNCIMPHPQTFKYLIPSVPQAFSPLNLFANEFKGDLFTSGSVAVQELESVTTEDLNTRLMIMNGVFKDRMLKNLTSLHAEGGDVGRESKNCSVLLEGI